MNPQIRYGDPSQNPNGIKFIYDETRPIDRMYPQTKHDDLVNQCHYQAGRQDIAASQPILTRHKSNNVDLKFYQDANFTQSYKLESNPSFINHDNSTYKSTNYQTHQQNTNQFETANDFFTVAAESVKFQEKLKKQTFNNSHPIKSAQYSSQPHNIFFPQTTRNEQFQQAKTHNFDSNSKECQKCEQSQKKTERIMIFMREQLQIGVKQFTQRMNKIIVEQAKQIKDLRKSLINNEKQLISFHKNYKNQNYNHQNFREQRTLSPSGKGVVKQRSPSKLSLTKSNTSISQNNASRQKITMVSKDLSPSKTSIHNNFKKLQKETSFIQQQRLSSTIQMPFQPNLNSEEIQRKIKTLEEQIQFMFKLENQINEKSFFTNKKIETLEKGTISFFGSKTQKLSSILNSWMHNQEGRLKELYNEMKVISSRVGSMANNPSNHLKQISSTNLNMSQNSSHSTPSIGLPQNYKEQTQELNLNKISVKLKHFSSQIEQLKEMAINLQTKEYKYDSYMIENLKRVINDLRSEIQKLQNFRSEISCKLEQNELKLQKAIEMSKFSQLGSHTEIYPSNNLPKISKANIMRNHSVELTYSDKGYNMSETRSRSIKNQVPVNETSQLAKFSKVPQHYNKFENLHSHSEFKGFVGEESGFSQYVEQSVYNDEADYRREDHEESFERSEEESEQRSEEEQDEFFYPVDLNNEQRSQNLVNERNIATSQKFLPSQTINRFMEVIEYRENKPLRIQIDQTGYIKSADNGMYIVDRNMDGFDLNRNELEWLRRNGVIILEK